MYGGNDKGFEEVASEVKERVIGQDAAVDWLCAFVDAACERSRRVVEEGVSPQRLPDIASALLVGPTASGKSHLLKTFAEVSGLHLHQIDGGQMTGEGWRGNSFSEQWLQVSEFLDANPGSNALVFIDEVDKMLDAGARGQGGSAQFDLLKPLEGGRLSGMTDNNPSRPFTLDCDRCVFVLAGAFTGIEDIIARRLGRAAGGVGFTAPAGAAPSDEADLRARITLDDIEAWGMPRELGGRISTVHFISALGARALHRIVHAIKQEEYRAMLPDGARFTIDADAEDLIVSRALAEHYGARSINRQLNELVFGAVWRALPPRDTVAGVTVTAREGALAFTIERRAAAPAATDVVPAGASRSERLHARAAYGLLRAVNERIAAAQGGENLDPTRSLGADATGFAAALLRRTGGVSVTGSGVHVDHGFALAEVTLLFALYHLLSDWFGPADQTPEALRTLLSLAEFDGRRGCPLDVMFDQLATGRKYAQVDDGPAAGGRPRWAWVPTQFVRRADGLRPADSEGLAPGQDRALDYYREFCGYPAPARVQAISSLAFRLLG